MNHYATQHALFDRRWCALCGVPGDWHHLLVVYPECWERGLPKRLNAVNTYSDSRRAHAIEPLH